MRKTFCIAVALGGLLAFAGCKSDPTASTEVDDQRAPLAGSSANSLNSPTAGPTSEGLPGGTDTDTTPEFNSDRGARTH